MRKQEEILNLILHKKKLWKRILIVIFWLLVWQMIALLINNKLLLVTPIEAFRVLSGFIDDLQFWQTIAMSLLRIISGLFLGVSVGGIFAFLSYRFSFVEELIKPLMNLLKTVPVVSFVVLLLIWWGAGFLSVCICFLIVFPNIYVGTLEGLKSTPKELLEVKKVFGLSWKSSFFYIYRPALKPFLNSSLSIALGMCWKSGVAAEVIGTPAFSIGEQIYLSKIYLDTGGIFAWTAVIIFLSLLFEKGCMKLVDLFFRWEPEIKRTEKHKHTNKGCICCQGVHKAFGTKKILEDYSATFAPDEITYLTWPSGKGKTTLLRILAGLETVDQGTVTAEGTCSFAFQEDRLCLEYSAVKNIEMVLGDRKKSKDALLTLLDEEELERPCSQLSGGQKRRVALVRAMEADSDFVLLDEPFTGMDQQTRQRAKCYIAQKMQKRTVIIATHI